MKNTVFLALLFALAMGASVASAQHAYTPFTLTPVGTTNVTQNLTGAPAATWLNFTVTCTWSQIAGAPWSNEARLSFTDGGTTTYLNETAPTTGGASSGATTTLTWTGSFLATFPGGASTLQLRARQTFTGSTATWTNIAVTITAPSSEINVQRSAVNVLHSSTDFIGSGFTAATPANLTYTIQNLSTLAALNIASISTSGTPVNCGVAYGALTPASPIPAGGTNSATFVVTVTPAAAGAFSFTISIDNDDTTGSEDPYLINVAGAVPLTGLQSFDFEGTGGGNNWIVGGTNGALWQRGTPASVGPAAAHGGSECFGTIIAGNYAVDSAQAYLVSPAMSLAGLTSPRLNFWHWMDAEGTTTWWDGGVLQVSTDGTNWTTVSQADAGWVQNGHDKASIVGCGASPGWGGTAAASSTYQGGTNDWREVVLNLFTMSSITLTASNTVTFRFWFGTDTSGNTWPGWYIDDVSITDATAPTITSAAPAAGVLSTAYNHTYTATGNPSTFTWTVTAGALPTGLTLSAGGVISGSPTATGNFTGTVTCANGISPDATQNFNIDINEAPTITNANNTAFVVGTAGSFNFTATGFPATFTWSTASTLPTGVTLSAGGVLSGTPAAGQGGTYNLAIVCSNGISPDANQAFTLTVNEAPTFTSAAPANGTQGVPYTHNYAASGFPATFTFTLTAGTLPTGLTLSGGGALSGTPSAAGNYTGTVTCSNGISPDATQNFNITIAPPGPTIVTSTAGTLALGTTTQGIAGTPSSYTVQGLSLTNDISIMPPTGVEIGLVSGGPYQTTALTLTQSGGAVAVTTIYVRIAASASVGAVSGDIVHTSTSATTQNVSVTGTMNAGIPEINVQRLATNVLDSSTDAIGSVPNGVAQTVTYTIQNLGFGTLNITTTPNLVAISGTVNITSATLTTPPASTVAGGGTSTSTFTITYTVTAAAAFSFDLSIDNNDGDEATYNWTVSGTGASMPEMDVTRSGAVADGGTDALTGAVGGTALVLSYTITNNGNAALSLTLPVTIGALTNCTCTVTTAPTASVAAAGSTTLVITITPIAAGLFSAPVTIINDDADENPYNWTISGTATTASGGGGGGSGGGGGCSTGESNSLWMLAGVLASFALALRLRRKAA
ncbi:MAG: hypothetical protein IT461_10170 [Planctomycetes bacterium]|nr:hypothetical protein [Planctomycetota bacterium]